MKHRIVQSMQNVSHNNACDILAEIGNKLNGSSAQLEFVHANYAKYVCRMREALMLRTNRITVQMFNLRWAVNKGILSGCKIK